MAFDSARIALIWLPPDLPPVAAGPYRHWLRARLLAPGSAGAAARLAARLRARLLQRTDPGVRWLPAIDPLLLGPALEAALWDQGTVRFLVPATSSADDLALAAAEATAWRADELLLLGADALYSPWRQGMTLAAWHQAQTRGGDGKVPWRALCCHPRDPLLLRGLVQRVRPLLTDEARLLLLAPWPLPPRTGTWQLRLLADELAGLLGLAPARISLAQLTPAGLRLPGPVPDAVTVLERMGPGPVIPLALAEWPEDLASRLAAAPGPATLVAVPPPVVEATAQVERLAALVRQLRAGPPGLCPGHGRRLCPADHPDCPLRPRGAAMQPAA